MCLNKLLERVLFSECLSFESWCLVFLTVTALYFRLKVKLSVFGCVTEVKLKQSRYRPGVAQRVLGS